MERYQRVEKADVPISENEIRITSKGLIRNYISYSSSLLQERQVREIVLKAMGQAISKTVAIAEIIKKRMPRLHQDTAISSVNITDVWEPIEEGLVPVEMTRHVSMISTWSLIRIFQDIKLPFIVTRPSLSIAISSNNIPDKHVLCIILSMKILMAEEGVEGEGEGETGVGGDMEIIKEETIRAETTKVIIIMVEIILGVGIIKVEAIIKVEGIITAEATIKAEAIIKADTIKIMVDIQIMDTGVNVAGAGAGPTADQGMRGAEVEVAEAMAVAVAVGGWACDLGVVVAATVATNHSKDLVVHTILHQWNALPARWIRSINVICCCCLKGLRAVI